MNIEQVREIFESFSISSRIFYASTTKLAFKFKDDRFYIEHQRLAVFKERNFCGSVPQVWHTEEDPDPSFWFIYKLEPRGSHLATVADEFELQDWLINEYRTS